ncbi:MAG: PKD domain-containing protein, partial [Candidatus Thorarchaeota archaeon]
IYTIGIDVEVAIPGSGEEEPPNPFPIFDSFLLILSSIFGLMILVFFISRKSLNLRITNLSGNRDDFYDNTTIRSGSKSRRKKILIAISVLFFLLSSFLIGCQVVKGDVQIINFDVSTDTADVGEDINFIWSFEGAYHSSYINFGDGNVENITDLGFVGSFTHSYLNPGRYEVMFYILDYEEHYTNETIDIFIKNEPPVFDINFNCSGDTASEDEPVEISVINIVDSVVDMVPGIITYIYDFADGTDTQVSTNQTSIVHSWKNEGIYPVTITGIDDQGAIYKNIKEITITNSPPIAQIDFNVDYDFGESSWEYYATYDWRNDAPGSTPYGWSVSEVLNPNDTSSINIIDEESEHDRIVKIYDNSTEGSISMETQFSGQTEGQVEFWAKTEDINSKTWAFSLWDNGEMALQVLIADGEWKYRMGQTYNQIEGQSTSIDSPENFQWYHINIDFILDNINGNSFIITINDIESKQYNIINQNFVEINKIIIQSGIQSVGTGYIDAIGFSWDEDYYVGSNRYTRINYPDKSLFLLSGANSKDTTSDIDSLRFYWQFGDNTSAYGKNVYHYYSESGIYKVILTVKDDNGMTDTKTHFISVSNKYPSINIIIPNDNITIFEGENIYFNTISTDDLTDLAQLQYYWFFEFDNDGVSIPENPIPIELIPTLSELLKWDTPEVGGWNASHLYKDDFNGLAYVAVEDAEGSNRVDSVNIEVLNRNPSISIYDANIVSNSYVLISRSDLETNMNFTIDILANEDPEVQFIADFVEPESKFVQTNEKLISMSLSKDWKVKVNTSIDIPDLSWIKYDYVLEFLNGEELVISSGRLYGGDAGMWEVNLNPYFYDEDNFNIKYPMTLNAEVWDPSRDDITINSTYTANFMLNVSSATPLAENDLYTYEYVADDGLVYNIVLFEDGGFNYANITVNGKIISDFYGNNIFPVNLDLEIVINPLMDFKKLINLTATEHDLDPFSINQCLKADHGLHTNITDDDGGTNELQINYTSLNEIEFENLSPRLNPIIPDAATGGIMVTIYAEVSDYDLIYEFQEDFINQILNNATFDNKFALEYLTTSDLIPSNLHNFIETLHKKYDTKLKENASNISI